MSVRPLRSRSALALFPLLLAATVLLAGCGKEAGVAVPAGGSSDSTDAAFPDPGTGSDSGPDSSIDTGSGGGAYDKSRTVKLDVQLRVVNTYRAPKAADGSSIDVWAGSPINGGRKLATVAYGQVSPYFAAEIPDPYGQGVTDPATASYTMSFYPAGSTADADLLIQQGENASPGQKLTMVIGPVDPTDTDAKGGTARVLADDVGSSPKSSGFPDVTLPKIPAGQAALLLDADALQGRTGSGSTSQGLSPSTTDGKCLPYFETDNVGLDYTGKVHDMGSSTVDLFGGTQYLVYEVAPGESVRVNQLKDNQTVTDACADKPVFGPFDPQLGAGQGKYAFLYGADLKNAKVVVVPVG